LLALAVAAACTCTDPENISVEPDCPGGKPASATMTIHGELAGIRPIGTDKQIRVRCTRDSDESVCFADGGQLSFTVMLEGQGTSDVLTPPLAHGVWALSVVPLSGGDHPELPSIPRLLQPGAAYVVEVTGDPEGDLQVEVTP